MTPKQELKIKIREVKEERRGLSDMEWYAYFAAQLIVEPQVYLDRVGLDIKSVDKYERVGTFHTETIRDATDEERQAWLYLQIIEGGNHKCSNISIDRCPNCIFKKKHGLCIATSPNIEYSREILKDKEVILEVS